MTDLLGLQNKLKRDPEGYRTEFDQQYQHFKASLEVFRLAPDKTSKDFQNLVTFVAHCTPYYKHVADEFPELIKGLLEEHYAVLRRQVRDTMVKALILLRNRGQITTLSVLPLFFTLFRCQDKELRHTLHSYIVADIKHINAKHRDNRTNKALQNFMFTMSRDANATAAKKSLDIVVELYRRKLWNDNRTVQVISECCFSPNLKMVVAAAKFFLGAGDTAEDSDDEDADVLPAKTDRGKDNAGPSAKEIYDAMHKSVKRNGRRVRRMERALAAQKKRERSDERKVDFSFSALQMVNDPQTFAERLFGSLQGRGALKQARWEVRLIVMNLISRLIGCHKLILYDFYDYLTQYLSPHKRDCTQVLAILAQACHDKVPPDALDDKPGKTGVLHKLTHEFVSDYCTTEAQTLGLNTIREICNRCPLVMNAALLRDLVQFRKSKDKGVMAAARGLMQVFRARNPELLHRRDRGKDATMHSVHVRQYGEENVAVGVKGIELLSDLDASDSSSDDNSDSDSDEISSDSDDDDGDEISSDSDKDGHGNSDEAAAARRASKREQRDRVRAEKEAARKAVQAERSVQRFLTDEDFERIRKARMNRALEKVLGKKEARSAELDEDDVVDLDEISESVNPEDLEGHKARKRRLLEARLAYEAEHGKEKFKRARKEKLGGSTNLEKQRSKPYMLVRQSRPVRQKLKRSMHEQMTVEKRGMEKTKKRLRKKKHY